MEKLIEPKFKVGDRVRPKNIPSFIIIINDITEDSYWYGCNNAFWIEDQDEWELVPNKFDINTLVPFDKVLVRTTHYKEVWVCANFSHINKDYFCSFWTTSGKNYEQCIPYEENKHLLGTTNDCDEYFKTWK